MLRHIVLLSWTDTASEAAKDRVHAELRALPARIPEIAALRCGPDAGLAPGNHDFALVADFAHARDWRTYQDHPAHKELIATHIAPILAGRTAVQFDAGD